MRRKLHDFFRSFRWPDVPKPLGVLWPNQLAVVIKDHPAVGVSHFQRERGRVFEVRQVNIGRIRQSKTILARSYAAGQGIRKSVNDASMDRSFPGVKLDFESSASASSATPAVGV